MIAAMGATIRGPRPPAMRGLEPGRGGNVRQDAGARMRTVRGPAMVRGSGGWTADRPRALRQGNESRPTGAVQVRSGRARGPTGPGSLPRFAHRRRGACRRGWGHGGHPAVPTVRRPSLVPLLGGTVLGTFLVVGGIVLAYVALATPVLQAVMPDGRPSIGKSATAVIVWAIALVAPAGFLLIGANRLARILASVRGRIPRRSTDAAGTIADRSDLVVASGIALPDGRGVPDLVIGQFGAAVIRELPPAEVTRVREGRWELRLRRGWVTIENPLDRAARDAERVRRWLAHDDADFIVKVYAAVVGPSPMSASDRLRRPHARSDRALDRRTAAAAQPDRWPPGSTRGVRASSHGLIAGRGVGRGARTRTWNQRDISPPL